MTEEIASKNHVPYIKFTDHISSSAFFYVIMTPGIGLIHTLSSFNSSNDTFKLQKQTCIHTYWTINFMSS